ncbi:hypothetical protein HMPREF0663_10573 [Hoylesella oralis ATCC 33269]|uniref:Uncharacterized protein n=1 Tax=Hoylesella oralis ATCC 33269 TaxID=873533 RepID=E7RN73_9BACT|nr:hypothetical protein HMPREF0663_10573 [Hoylesella oralis ATCC 33269]EPH16558.1 hypothetical protein HMPREF1475_01674 [Hoylesella oralis HGA0225]SHF36299.1 hypothetical protein SAMN05444288_0302 [Hoylesella oralis]
MMDSLSFFDDIIVYLCNTISELLRTDACTKFKITAKERIIIEMILPSNFLNTVFSGTQQQFQLHNHVMIDNSLRGMSGF